jgi:hypothetical protein
VLASNHEVFEPHQIVPGADEQQNDIAQPKATKPITGFSPFSPLVCYAGCHTVIWEEAKHVITPKKQQHIPTHYTPQNTHQKAHYKKHTPKNAHQKTQTKNHKRSRDPCSEPVSLLQDAHEINF